jgi:hypothetical protein
MTVEETQVYRMTRDKMSVDEMTVNKMYVNKMPIEQIWRKRECVHSADKMSID